MMLALDAIRTLAIKMVSFLGATAKRLHSGPWTYSMDVQCGVGRSGVPRREVGSGPQCAPKAPLSRLNWISSAISFAKFSELSLASNCSAA